MEEEVLEQQEEQTPAAGQTPAQDATASYTVSDFNLQAALAGNAVAYIGSTASQSAQDVFDSALSAADGDSSKITGVVVYEPKGLPSSYYAKINGVTYWINRVGEVVTILPTPATTYAVNKLVMVNATMAITRGTDGAMTRGVTPGHESDVDLSSMEPRDQFAIHALNSMLERVDHPESVDDSTILLYSRAAYKWAQGMVIASSDQRKEVESGGGGGGGTTPSTVAVDVSGGTTNDKLLNNIVVALGDLKAAAIGTANTNIAAKFDTLVNTITTLSNQNIAVPLNGIKAAIEKFVIPTVSTQSSPIVINASAQSNHLVLAFTHAGASSMAYSNLTVYLTITHDTSQSKTVTLNVPMGSINFIYEVTGVTTINAITQKTFGGKAYNDPNEYTIQ